MQMDVPPIALEGFDEIIKQMNQLPGLLGDRVQGEGLIAAARVVRDQAQGLVPVRTGALRDSIRARRRSATVETLTARKRVPGGAARVTAGGEGARHAALVEYGTVHSAAQPYMEPALISTQSQQLSSAREALVRAFAKLQQQLRTGRVTRTTARLAGS